MLLNMTFALPQFHFQFSVQKSFTFQLIRKITVSTEFKAEF